MHEPVLRIERGHLDEEELVCLLITMVVLAAHEQGRRRIAAPARWLPAGRRVAAHSWAAA